MLVKMINPALATTNGLNTDKDKSSPGLDVAIVRKAVENSYNVLDAIQYSYSGAGSAEGGIIIKDGDKEIFDLDLTDNRGAVDLYICGSPGKTMEVRLKSGGAGMIGKLNIQTHLESA